MILPPARFPDPPGPTSWGALVVALCIVVFTVTATLVLLRWFGL